jgi:hypothetical protein
MMTITIQPSISVATNSMLTICNTDVANIVAMVTGGVASFTWETSEMAILMIHISKTTL